MLFVVLFFALLLTSSIATFLRRSVVDSMIARNRENSRRADALARGGIRVAQALLLQDRLLEQGGEPAADTHLESWWSEQEIDVGEDAELRVRIEDTGAKLNLNALFEKDESDDFVPRQDADLYLRAVLEVVVEEMPIPPGEKALYDPRELAYNLIDWVDSDDLRVEGGAEDDYYQRQDPPYRAWNQPLISVEQLRLIEGYDARLWAALTPYVSVYPFAPGGCGNAEVGCGINLNTAPPWVLKLLYYNDGVDDRLATQEVVEEIAKVRQEGGTLCTEGQSREDCTPIHEIVANPIFPPPSVTSEIFVVTAEARVGEVRRTLEAAVDRSQPEMPRLLSWRVR